MKVKEQKNMRLLLPIIWACLIVLCILALASPPPRITQFRMADIAVSPFLKGFYAPEVATDGTTYRWTSGAAEIRDIDLSTNTIAIWYVTVAGSPQQTLLSLDTLTVQHADQRRYAFLAKPPSWDGVQTLHLETGTFADPHELRQLGVRVVTVSLVNGGRAIPHPFSLATIVFCMLMLACSAWMLGWGWRGVLVASLAMIAAVVCLQLISPRATGLWIRDYARIVLLVPVSVWVLRRWLPMALLTGWASMLALRLWGISGPGFAGHDYEIHLRRLSDFRTGIWTLAAHPYEFGRRESIILPLFYRTADALAGLLGTHLAMHLMIVCAETSIALLVWLMLRRLQVAARTALIAALVVLCMPLSTSVLYWSFMQQICAHLLTFGIAYLTIRRTNRSAWLAGLLLAVVALTHIGETFIAVVWYLAIRLAEPDRFTRPWWLRSLPALMAGVAVLPLYWTFLGRLGASGSPIVQPTSHDILQQMLVAFTVGLAPLPLLVASIVLVILLWQLPRLTIPWISVVVVFFGVELATRAQVRYLYTGAPLVAVALGWCIAPLWRKGAAGRLLVLLVVAFIAWVSAALWIDAVMGWQKPRIDGLTH